MNQLEDADRVNYLVITNSELLSRRLSVATSQAGGSTMSGGSASQETRMWGSSKYAKAGERDGVSHWTREGEPYGPAAEEEFWTYPSDGSAPEQWRDRSSGWRPVN